MKLAEAKKHFIAKHSLGHLTMAQLRQKANDDDLLIYGDKAQVLQCFNQSEQMLKLFKSNK